MSLFDSASLIVTPNGYKEDKLYSIKPTDGSGDLVVTRATTATRVNSSGLIEVVPYNLLQRSEQFDNAYWQKTNMVIVANDTTAPDGTNTADRATASFYPSTSIVRTNLLTAASHTLSVYVKSGSVSTFRLGQVTGGYGLGSTCIYNLSTLSTTITNYGVTTGSTATITNVGNGWYRCTLTVLTTAATYFSELLPAANGSVFIWGAQLVTGSSAKEYFPTTDRLDIPRLDYTNSTCPSILVEPQRTNIILNSQNFTAASWSATATTITANAGISPDGNNNANKFIPNTSATSHFISQIINSSSNGSISIYAKADGYNNITLLTSNTNVNYNLSTGTVQAVGGVGTGEIQSVGNGWYRCILYKVLATETIYISCGSNTNAGFFNGSGNGTSGVLIWGAQVEVGSYATSYIPTIASSVTRNADVIYKTGISSLIGQTEGTIFLDLQYSNTSGLDMFFSVRPNSSNKIEIFRDGGVIYAEIAATNSISISSSKPIGSYKIALAYKSGSTALYINGTLISQSTTTFNFTNTLSDLYLNSRAGTSFIESANFKTAAIFKTRLTNDELAQLTTI